MKEIVRQRAQELGFDDCRFTNAGAPDHAAQFQHWIAEKHHGEMAYLERNAIKRVDPQMVLPGAKSIIVLAASYETCSVFRDPPNTAAGVTSHGTRDTRHGIVARYARFKDYHDVLGERLKQLTQFLTELGGQDTRSLWYVDTGPCKRLAVWRARWR